MTWVVEVSKMISFKFGEGDECKRPANEGKAWFERMRHIEFG
jgi:hypothetical protein